MSWRATRICLLVAGVAWAWPMAGGAAAAAPAPVQTKVSPIDTLRMSPLEHVFWGRHGLMRVTGLFPLDQERPVNDLRQLAKVRRKMLSTHQMLGLATVASMAVTVAGGQRAINGNGAGLHKASLPITIGLYSTTAALALASPPKLVRRSGGADTITFHKWFAAAHLTGMILTPMIAPRDGSSASDRRRHQISGYSTFGAFTCGMLVVTVFN